MDAVEMREFLLLPFIIVAAVIGAAVTLLAMVIVGPILICLERKGSIRMGGIHQDRHLADLDCDPFPSGELPRLRRINGIDPED